MVQPLFFLPETPSQTAGPYVHIGLTPRHAGIEGIYPADLTGSSFEAGEAITITGTVRDGMGSVLRDVLLESWQADGTGRFSGGTEGFARFVADEAGEWRLRTVKPGRLRAPDGRMQAPHIALWIVARGINLGLATRIYFADEDNAGDPLLSRIEQDWRRETLLARKTGDAAYRFDIVLQGENETVFLDV